jgi:hypothetical protein
MNNLVQSPSIPLTLQDRQWVQRLAVQSGCQGEKLRRLIPNLLAVRAVAHWLDIYDIAYDWSSSYSTQPLLHLGEEVADLPLSGLGRLECRGISPQQQAVEFSPESWSERLGYVVVEINADLTAGRLLGCVEEVNAAPLPRERLEPINSLFSLIAQAELQKAQSPVANTIENGLRTAASIIQNWLTTAQQQAWQMAEFYLLEPSFSPVRSANTVERIIDKLHSAGSEAARQRLIITLGEVVKPEDTASVVQELTQIIDQTGDEDTRWLAAGTLARIEPRHPQAAHRLQKTIGAELNLADTALNLLIALMPAPDQTINGSIELKTANQQQSLPPGTRLTLLSAENEFVDEIAVTGDQTPGKNLLKIGLTIDPGTNFRIRVTVGEESITEDIQL